EQAELKRAFQSFSLNAPGLGARFGSTGALVALTQPARLTPASGGEVTIRALPGRSLYASRPGEAGGGGGFTLAAAGGGLPEAEVTVADWTTGDGGIEARLAGEAALDFGLG